MKMKCTRWGSKRKKKSTKPRDKRLVSKAAGPTNASKKTLTTALQVCHLLLQSLNSCVSSIYNGLNLFHEKGSGNLTKMVQDKLHNKTHIDQLLNRSPPLQNPLGRDSINKVMFNIIHYDSQQLQEMLPGRMTKAKSLLKVPLATENCL